MIPLTDLEAAGWTFDRAAGTGTKDGVQFVQVVSDFPLFALIRAANHIDGDDELMDDRITPELVQQVSGETWTPAPPPPPPVATAADHSDASAAIITEKLATTGITVDQLPTVLDTLLSEASPAIPFFEEYALDPSMTGQQWVAFQQIPLTTTDGSVSIYRLVYDLLRVNAALLRYLTGDLPTEAS
jgi:hypothetical protein